MVLFLLAVADACVPVLAESLPEALLKKLQPGKITGFLCLGNIDDSVVISLRRISTEIRRVAGDTANEAGLPGVLVCSWNPPQAFYPSHTPCTRPKHGPLQQHCADHKHLLHLCAAQARARPPCTYCFVHGFIRCLPVGLRGGRPAHWHVPWPPCRAARG
jgi:hypothetical protein